MNANAHENESEIRARDGQPVYPHAKHTGRVPRLLQLKAQEARSASGRHASAQESMLARECARAGKPLASLHGLIVQATVRSISDRGDTDNLLSVREAQEAFGMVQPSQPR